MSSSQSSSDTELDKAALDQEKRLLNDLESRGFVGRTRGYLKVIGPGYMQSAMTLGGGTAGSALFAGAVFGYQLLWVAPLAMLLGVIVLSAVSYQTLSTGVSPFEAMKKFAGAPIAWGWAFGTLISSIIWHAPQYTLATAVLSDFGEVIGVGALSRWWLMVFVLAWAIALSTLYGKTNRFVRLYERLLKYMVWGVVFCFALVVIKTGIEDKKGMIRGFLAFEIPGEKNGVDGATLVLSGLAAAVGINMVFLYPYSLRRRGWGREHRRLARFDLWTGMWIPYTIATSLIIIATANTIHLDPNYDGTRLQPVQAAQSLASIVGPTYGRVIFNLGVLGMALSTITLHMLACGFVVSEILGWKVGTMRYRIATLLPTPAALGAIFWADVSIWLTVPTTIISGCFLPIAYIGFLKLQRSQAYLGKDKPSGWRGTMSMVGLGAAALIMTAFLAWYAVTKVPGFWAKLLG